MTKMILTKKTALIFLGSFEFIVAFGWAINLMFILPQPVIVHQLLILGIPSIVCMFLGCFFFAKAFEEKQGR